MRSVLAQTLDAIEIIVVDDGSTDDLHVQLAPFVSDKRIRVVSQPNSGLAAARNRGLREARADLVAFVDADDIWHQSFLEEMAGALARQPDAPFAYSYMVRIDSENRIVPTPLWRHVPRHDLAGLIEVNSVANGSAAVFRKSDLLDLGGFDETLRARNAQGAEDWKLALQLAARATPVVVPRQLVAYRIAAQSMSRQRPDKQLRGIEEVISDTRRAFPDIPERHFRNARTVMNGWLLPAFLSKGHYREVARLLWVSYARNPLFFLSRDVRAVHRHKLMSLALGLLPRQPLADLDEGGVRPFGFLKVSARYDSGR